MHHCQLVCTGCGSIHDFAPIYACQHCGASLDIQYDYDHIFAKTSFADMAARTADQGIWKYRELLPVNPDIEPVTLGEGQTPLLCMNRIFNSRNIQIKMESLNPTLAFKDRPLATALTAAKQFAMREVVCASTGNTGVAASAYAARAGVRCTVYVPEATPSEKLSAMEQYGAQIRLVSGTFSDAYNIASQEAVERRAFNLTSTYLNPFMVEGDKTVAYEIVEQSQGDVPDWIVIPIGAGPLLFGCYKGFKEMRRAGYIDKLPRMVGVQAAGCAPIVEAYETGRPEVEPWQRPIMTKASGISDPLTSYPADGTRTLSVIRESNGVALAIAEEDLFATREQLAQREGILAELSSVTAVAAVHMMLDTGKIGRDENVVMVVTGHGIKDMTVTR